MVDDVEETAISTDTHEWVATISETAGVSEERVIEKCCRYGLLNYEEALDEA